MNPEQMLTEITEYAVSYNDYICKHSEDLIAITDLSARLFFKGYGLTWCGECKRIHLYNLIVANKQLASMSSTLFETLLKSHQISEDDKFAHEKIRELVKTHFVIPMETFISESRQEANHVRANNAYMSVAKIAKARKFYRRFREQNPDVSTHDYPVTSKVRKIERTGLKSTAKQRKSLSNRRKKDKQGRAPGTATIPHTEAGVENLLELYTCFRKVGYILQEAAKEAIIKLHYNERENMSVYMCTYCTGWHIGHTPSLTVSKNRRQRMLLTNASQWWKLHPTDADQLSKLKGLIK